MRLIHYKRPAGFPNGRGAFLPGLSPAQRFPLPVVLETILNLVSSQVTAMMIGRISGASLAASGMGNMIITFITAAFAMIITGSAVLISRRVGAGDPLGAADTLEQSISMLAIASTAAAALLFLLSGRLLRLLMPSAEDALMGEALVYLRVNVVSFPFLMMSSLLSGALRAEGNSRSAMILNVSTNALMALFAWIFIVLLGKGILGAGLAYLLARVIGAGLAVFAILRPGGRFTLRPAHVLRPRPAVWKSIFRMGAPISVESVAVQGGYLAANALVVGLGTFDATVYQVATSVNNFTWAPNGVCSATSQTMVAMSLGEGDVPKARRITRNVWLAGAGCVLGISILMAVFARPLAGVYSSDPRVIAACVPVLLLCIPMSIPAMSINTMDAALRAAGETRFVMFASLVGVWIVRLPLSWLFGYHFGWGVMGIFLANFASFLYRMTLGLVRFNGKRHRASGK